MLISDTWTNVSFFFKLSLLIIERRMNNETVTVYNISANMFKIFKVNFYIHTTYLVCICSFWVLTDKIIMNGHCIKSSGGPLSALTCCVNVRLLSAIKKISPLIYSQSWVGSWVYTTQAMMTFTLIF